MNINWEKVKQKAVDIAIDGGKSFVIHAEKTAQMIEKEAAYKAKQNGRVLSNKTYDKFDDLYDTIDNAYTCVDDTEYRYHSKYMNTDEDAFYGEYEQDEENTEKDFSEEEYEAKVKQQINFSSKTFELTQDDISKMENEWHPLGKLTNIECSLISTDVAGLLRLSFANEIVYIVRVIEINSGGFQKKVKELKNFSNIKNRKLREMICQNLNDIDVEILSVGKNAEDVDFVRSLEKDMIKYYAPKWN